MAGDVKEADRMTVMIQGQKMTDVYYRLDVLLPGGWSSAGNHDTREEAELMGEEWDKPYRIVEVEERLVVEGRGRSASRETENGTDTT